MEEALSAQHAQGSPLSRSGMRPDRLPGLAAIIEAFAIALAKETEKFLVGPLTFQVEGIDSVRLSESLSAIPGLPTAVLFSPEINAQAFIIFDAQFGWMMIEASFFGASSKAAEASERRAQARATSVGARFVTEVAQIAAVALAAAISRITPASFKLQRMEATGDAPLENRRDAPMLAARIAIKTAIGDGRLVLLLPQSAIGRLRQGLSEAPPRGGEINDPLWTREFGDALSMTTVEVAAVIEDLQLSLGEVSNFKIGTVLGLRGSGLGRVRLACNGRDLFRCRLAQNDERYELEIE